MRVSLLFIGFSTLSLTASCVRPSMLADAGDAVLRPTALVAAVGFVVMPPLYVDGRDDYGQKVKRASAEATNLCARELNCPAVRVRRADSYVRADGTSWTVVRLNACGEERVYAKTGLGWDDATARLR